MSADAEIEAFIAACPLGKELLYGFFMGGDPRDFLPDEETNTPQELAAWREAVALWNLGEPPSDEQGGCWNSGAGFGLGMMYTEVDDELVS